MPDCESGDIRSQTFYKDINWESLEHTKIDPPFKPKIVRLHFTSIFFSNKHLNIGSMINKCIPASFLFLASNLQLFKLKHQYYIHGMKNN